MPQLRPSTQGGSDGKSPPAVQDMGSIPGSESSPAEEKATHSSILAWRIPWTEKPDGLHEVAQSQSSL